MLSWVFSSSPSSFQHQSHREGWEFLDSPDSPPSDPRILDVDMLSETLSDFAWHSDATPSEPDTSRPAPLHRSGSTEKESVYSFYEPGSIVPTLPNDKRVVRRASVSASSANAVAVKSAAEQYILRLKDREKQLNKMKKLESRRNFAPIKGNVGFRGSYRGKCIGVA